LYQHAVFIAQVNGQAVKLELGYVLHCRVGISQAQRFAHAGIKILCACGLGIGLGIDTEHGHRVFDGRKAIQHSADDALGGRVGCDQFRVIRFQLLQLLEQSVVFCIGDLRCVEHVVLVRMVVQLLVQGISLLYHSRYFFNSFSRDILLARRLIRF
jgi:hypothetical protein